MSNKKKNKSSVKMPYFKTIYEQMLDDETKEFWDLVPVENTLFGRTVSHVIFRTVGVDIAKYLASRLEANGEMPSLAEGRTPEEVAEMEFLSAWHNMSQNYASLQLEAISFRALINHRDYQLWLAETLMNIPLPQWEKVKQRYTQVSGNPAYIAAFNAWLDALRNRPVAEGVKVSWLPYSEMTSIEKYVVARTIKGYAMDEELQEKVNEWRNKAKRHGYLSMALTQGRVNSVYNAVKVLGYTDFGLTETGIEYYEHAATLWGLWAESISELVSDEIVEDEKSNVKVIASLANSLVNSASLEVFGRMRSSFINEWSQKKRVQFEEIEEKRQEDKLQRLEEENTRLKRELGIALNKVSADEKEIRELKKDNKELLAERDGLNKKCLELMEKLKHTEKKLAKANEAVKAVSSEAKHQAPASPDKVTALENKVSELETGLKTVTTKLDDLYALLSAEEDDDDIENSAEVYENTNDITEMFKEAARELAKTSRVILNGGAGTWQNRVRKWFESQGVKVRTYDLGDCPTGIRPTDLVIMNVIQNKHKYSVQLMDGVRDIGAKLVICNVNNVEQTLRIVFGHPDHKKC